MPLSPGSIVLPLLILTVASVYAEMYEAATRQLSPAKFLTNNAFLFIHRFF
jgi:hypothetical protein